MLRLLTYNLESLGERSGAPPLDARVAVLRPRLVGMAADVLCLQEIDGQRSLKGRPREPLALRKVIEHTGYADFHLAATPGPGDRGIADRHNLVTLSRLPIAEARAVRHEFVAPPKLRAGPFEEIEAPFDRAQLYTSITLPDRRRLHVINLHLRAPLAVRIPGAQREGGLHATVEAWAVGYQLAAMKRTAQALEARLMVDRVLDQDPDALIAVCGDLNAGSLEVPARLLIADPSDTANPLLAGRRLIPLADIVPAERRFSVRHHGRTMLVDHILASPALAALCRAVEIHNQGLVDESAAEKMGAAFADSTHAALVAAFDIG